MIFLLHVQCQIGNDKNGTIKYCEFVAATMDPHKKEKGENLFKAFQYFDKDDKGLVYFLVL